MDQTPGVKEMIRFSWAKSLEVLKPFNFKRWLKILIIVWLAGAGIQGCSANFNPPKKPVTPPQTVDAQKPQEPAVPKNVSPTSTEPAVGAVPQGTEAPAGGAGTMNAAGQSQEKAAPAAAPKIDPAVVVPIVVAAIVLVLGLGLLFMWIGCRFNFILFDTILTKEAAFREPFHRHKEIGNSYFKWSLAFMGIGLAAILIIILLLVLFFWTVKGNTALGIVAGALGWLLVLAVLSAMFVTGVVVHDFVSPIMYFEKIPTMAAVRKFLGADRVPFGKIFQYLLLVVGLGVLAMIAQAVVSLVVMIAGLLAGGIIAVPGFLLIKAVPALQLPLILIGVLLLIALILAAAVVIGMVMLPASIFFRTFALTYLTRLHPEYDLLGFLNKR